MGRGSGKRHLKLRKRGKGERERKGGKGKGGMRGGVIERAFLFFVLEDRKGGGELVSVR